MKKNKNDNRKFNEAWDSPYSPVSDREIDESWERFAEIIKTRTEKNHRKYVARISGVAALLLVLLSTYFFVEIYNPIKSVHNISQVELKVELPDGSLVFLKKGATIEYKEQFKNSRGVQLKGSAFFKVAEDSLKVFAVTTGQTQVKVFGTTFYIQGKEFNENVAVSLFTGSVSVAVRNKIEPQKIVPGERFVYHEGRAHIETFDVNLSFERGNTFVDVDHITVKKLYNFLGNRFDYRFEINPNARYKEVTLRIEKSDSLEQILKIVSIISNTTYEVNPEKRTIQILSK